jgi:hypothetical protein
MRGGIYRYLSLAARLDVIDKERCYEAVSGAHCSAASCFGLPEKSCGIGASFPIRIDVQKTLVS